MSRDARCCGYCFGAVQVHDENNHTMADIEVHEVQADASTSPAPGLKLENLQEEDEGYSGPPSPTDSVDIDSELATGVGTVQEGDQDNIDQLSDHNVSDTGWDTDLDIEEEKEEYDVTGGKAYTKTCETLGIIPAKYFLRTVQAKEVNICMAHHGIGPKGAKAISVALVANTSVTHLDLSDNGLGTEGAIAISTMMKENCYISHLDLSDNAMGPPASFAIGLMVGSNNTLVSLGLRGNGFNDKSVEPLAELIKSSYHIKHLDLSHNDFGEQSGEILGPALAESEALQTLDLSWNQIRRKGAKAVAVGLMNNQSLKVLNLAYNGFANEGAVEIANALRGNSTLQELDITNNRITTDGALVLAKALPTNESLTVFKVGKNALQIPGIYALLDAVRSGSGSSLQHLGFDGITITLDIDKTLKEMQESHPNLKIVHGGTGGYQVPKPLPTPIEKLTKYCSENNVRLIDLFRTFDKEQHNSLPETEFRNALRHISAPLMEFERLKLIKAFQTDPPPPKPAEEGAEGEPTPTQPLLNEDGTPMAHIDYMKLVESADSLSEKRTETVSS